MDRIQCQVCVIGAGIAGVSAAWRLAAAGMDVIVVERGERSGMGTTSRNSEVIHAGLYYPEGSLKAKLCIEGRDETYHFCERYGVAHRKTGKIITAVSESEDEDLDRLCRRAQALGVNGLRPLSAREVETLEPSVRCSSAWLSEESGIISAHELCNTVARLAAEAGVTFAYRATVLGLECTGAGWNLVVGEGNAENGASYAIDAKLVVNAAGLYADDIAARAGMDVDALGYRQTWVRGDYFSLSGKWRGAFNHLVYPMPEKNARGLGTHVTIDLAGNARLGPNVVEIDRREKYDVDVTSATQFFDAASRYIRGIQIEDLAPAYSGIRPKLSKPGEAARDFVIEEGSIHGFPGLINLFGIESPGLTSGLAIGRLVAQLAGVRDSVWSAEQGVSSAIGAVSSVGQSGLEQDSGEQHAGNREVDDQAKHIDERRHEGR